MIAQQMRSVCRTGLVLVLLVSACSGTMPVSSSDMQAGDVLFFSIEGKMSHVGLYLGDGRFVHAPSTGKTVSVESLSSAFYRDALIRGRTAQIELLVSVRPHRR